MENLLSTIIFILPGFMLYFWIQIMGVNPVVKHTVPEFGAMAALAWFPVVASTLLVMRLFRDPINTMEGLYEASKDLRFLLEFTGISILFSFILAALYVTWVFPLQQRLVNAVRKKVGKTELSKSPSVWEEVFFNNEVTIVGIAKYGSTKPDVYGNIEKVSRPFEAKRAMKLIYTVYTEKLITTYGVSVKDIYSDIDSGVNVFIYDYEEYKKADQKEREKPEYLQTPPRSQRTTS